MSGFSRRANRFLQKISFFSSFLDRCSHSAKPLATLKLVHAQLIKLGFNADTYLCNRCIDIYLRSGSVVDASDAFHDILSKNIFSWNLYLKVYVKCSDIRTASQVFDDMPERDVVSWNTIISGYVSSGFLGAAWNLYIEMQRCGIQPSDFTFSILISSINCVNYAKEMHGSMIRNSAGYKSLVVGNSMIDAYGKLGLVDYAFSVFFNMEVVDVISWNSLISGLCTSGHEEIALYQFRTMASRGFRPDEYTYSTVLSACSNLRNIEKGKQILSCCIKMGFIRNTIVCSAAIDMFSRCNRIESAISVFDNSHAFDSALSNSMIACYTSHGLEENALELFVLSLRKDVRPTEFTFSCALSASAVFISVEQGSQIHSLVIKSGFESEVVVASSLVEMYSKNGLIEISVNIFGSMCVRDLVAWNTIILGLTHHGKLAKSIELFQKLLETGMLPDRITFAGVLLACSYGGFLEVGMPIFSLMEQYGVKPINEHYACVVDMMSRAGKIEEAIDFLQMVQCEPDASMCESILRSSGVCRNVEIIERVAERMIELEVHSLLPYVILAKIYEQKGRWESFVRVRKEIEKMTRKVVVGCSWISIRDRVFSFEGNKIFHHGGKDVYSVLQLLAEEMWDDNSGLSSTDHRQ